MKYLGSTARRFTTADGTKKYLEDTCGAIWEEANLSELVGRLTLSDPKTRRVFLHRRDLISVAPGRLRFEVKRHQTGTDGDPLATTLATGSSSKLP